jgi:hypothetical protein
MKTGIQLAKRQHTVSLKLLKQKVLGRNNLFSFDTTKTTQKKALPAIFRCREIFFTMPLLGNNMGDTHADTETGLF